MKILKFKPTTSEKLPVLIGVTSKRIINMQGEYTVFGMLPDGEWAPIAGKYPLEIDTLTSMRDLLFMIKNYIRVYDGMLYKGMTMDIDNIYQTYIDDRRDISVN